MKNINYLNYFAVGLPFGILITYPVFKEVVFAFALLSTMLTGLIQVILGIKLLIDNPSDKNLKIYISGVFLYFTLLFMSSYLDYFISNIYVFFSIPPALALLLSVIIYKKIKNENNI